MKDGYIDFDEYIRQGEHGQKKKAGYWQTAIGLHAVDGLKGATSDIKGATLDAKGATSDIKGATSSSKGATSLSARMSKDKLRGEIIAYCSEWRTATEIAEYLGKTKPYIRNRVLPQMSDVLQMLFPKENHPGQKYKVKEQ